MDGAPIGYCIMDNCTCNGDNTTPPIVANTAGGNFVIMMNSVGVGRGVNANSNPVQMLYDAEAVFAGPDDFLFADTNLVAPIDSAEIPKNNGSIASSIFRFPSASQATNVIANRFVTLGRS